MVPYELCVNKFLSNFFWAQILNFLALRPNAGPTQTHAGCGLTPYDFLAHVDHVLFEDYFFVFRSILQRCAHKDPLFGLNLEHLTALSNFEDAKSSFYQRDGQVLLHHSFFPAMFV